MRKGIKEAAIIGFLKANPGKLFSVGDIASEIGDAGTGYVRKVLSDGYKEGSVERVRSGNAWYYCYVFPEEDFKPEKRSGGYTTRQRKAVLRFFFEHEGQSFSAEDVLQSAGGMSRSTCYRVIDYLADKGYIIKAAGRGHRQCWQYAGRDDCSGHIHVECENCGRIEHLDAESTKAIRALVGKSTGYAALNDTVIKGLCPECREKKA